MAHAKRLGQVDQWIQFGWRLRVQRRCHQEKSVHVLQGDLVGGLILIGEQHGLNADAGRKFAHVASSGSNSDSFGSEGRDNRSAEVSSGSGDKNSFHSPY